jgi:hypothetical protein
LWRRPQIGRIPFSRKKGDVAVDAIVGVDGHVAVAVAVADNVNDGTSRV